MIMRRFKWIRQTSRTACVSATVTRSLLKNIDVEIALDMSLPNYAVNPESLSKIERKRVLKEAQENLKRIKESRQSGTSCQRRGG